MNVPIIHKRYTEQQLQDVYKEVSHPVVNNPVKGKFVKLYSGPGYPVEPKKDKGFKLKLIAQQAELN